MDDALKSPAFYIGALGLRRTHAARLQRLRDLGHNDKEMTRIRGPVGLNIEAVTAPEIALSIMAEVVAAHRGFAARPEGRSVTRAASKIHDAIHDPEPPQRSTAHEGPGMRFGSVPLQEARGAIMGAQPAGAGERMIRKGTVLDARGH